MDARFAHVRKDPRFKTVKKDKVKVSIDNRFSKVLEENSEFVSQVGIDKYGRKVKQSKGLDELKRYYRLDPQAETQGASESDHSVEYFEREEAGNGSETSEQVDLARGEGLVSSSEEEDSELEISDEELPVGPNAEDNVPRGDETRRFAAINLDWDHVKAATLFKVFDAFTPKSGFLKSVKIYRSEFGKERMKEEAVQGPPKKIFRNPDDSKNRKKVKSVFNPDEGEDFNNKELRKYQIERLRYFYAVIECDSVQTARVIYQACDGAEFESSSNFFDLRYIPDDMVFDEDPEDEASESPQVYQPADFVTKALQHSKVDLTWDNDDPHRKKITRRKFTKDDLQNMDFKAYIASGSEDEEEPEEDVIQKYKSLLQGSDNQNDEEVGDVEVTFTPGLSETAEKLLEKKKEKEELKNETVFEQKLRTMKEKKKMKKIQKKQDEDALVSDNSIPSDDDFFNQDVDSGEETKVNTPNPKKAKPSKKQNIETTGISKEELELLMLPDTETSINHFSAQQILKSEKSKKKKKKQELTEVQDDFKINPDDDRFKDVFESHHFAIDPTHPGFKKTKNLEVLLKKGKDKIVREQNDDIEESKNSNEKSSLNSLVEAVKRKSTKALSGKGKRAKTRNKQ